MDFKKLKGNLGLKSSALAPTACKLSSQYLVLDHMSNHYMKIARAKSAIDSRPPKSLSSSQKMRDRMSQGSITKSPVLSTNSSMPGMKIYDYEYILKDEPEDEEERLVHSIMRSTLLDKPGSGYNAVYESISQENMNENDAHLAHQIMHESPYSMSNYPKRYNQPASVRSMKSGHSYTSSTSRQVIPTNTMGYRIVQGDVLEKRPHLFTDPERPFTPRTLKKNTESRLKNSKCYNPPKIKHDIHSENSNEKGTDHVPKIIDKKLTSGQNSDKISSQRNKSPPKISKYRKVKDSSNNESQNAPKLTDSMLMDMTVHSQAETFGQNINYNVPPLAITMDQDHMNWLQEQASKAEVRVRNSSQLKSSLRFDEELQPTRKYPNYREHKIKTDANKEKQRKEEEQKYLAFAKEVTDDVLTRGISTDSVLHRLFENHIERRKSDLDEDRMRKVISDLRKNLGLKETTMMNGKTLASMSNSNYNNKLGKEGDAVSEVNQQKVGGETSDDRNGHHHLSQTNMFSELGSTLESESTLKFGQTGGILSTIDSQEFLEVKEKRTGHNTGSELTESQMLKHYELSLTAKEERYDHRDGHIDDNGSVVLEKEKNKMVHSPQHEIHKDNEERKIVEEKNLNSVSKRERRRRSAGGSQKGSSVDTNIDGDGIFSGSSHPMSENLHNSESNEVMSNKHRRDSYSQDSNNSIHRNQDIENKPTTLPEQPTAKPRTRIKQFSHDSTQDSSAPISVDTHQDNKIHVDAAEKENQNKILAQEEHNFTPTQTKLPDNVKEDTSKVNRHDNDHQQSSEGNDDYEDDYEEIFESEDINEDSADDF